MKPLPLSGIKVLECSHAVLGPACGLVLADLGAAVIRVEKTPEGDDTRRLKGFGMGYFPFFNRNKQSIAVDLKAAEGVAIIKKLVAGADVLIENFAPGTMDRLGLGYEALSALNPRLIYCALKGFMTGPYEQRTALDEVVQMMSGLAYMTGPPGQPLRAGASVIDIMGGLYGALGVLVALRERDATGKGTLVQSGLFETAAFVMGHHMAYAATSGAPVPPMPTRVSAWSIYRTFATQEGDLVFVAVTSDKHWQRFCAVFGREDLATDARLATNNDRIAQRDWLLPDLERMFAAMPRADILRGCEQAEIPFAPIARPEDLFDDPHLNGSGSLLETTLPDGTQAKLPRQPLLLGGEGYTLHTNPPAAGAHTRQVLLGLGYSEEEIEALVEKEVVILDADYAD